MTPHSAPLLPPSSPEGPELRPAVGQVQPVGHQKAQRVPQRGIAVHQQQEVRLVVAVPDAAVGPGACTGPRHPSPSVTPGAARQPHALLVPGPGHAVPCLPMQLLPCAWGQAICSSGAHAGVCGGTEARPPPPPVSPTMVVHAQHAALADPAVVRPRGFVGVALLAVALAAALRARGGGGRRWQSSDHAMPCHAPCGDCCAIPGCLTCMARASTQAARGDGCTAALALVHWRRHVPPRVRCIPPACCRHRRPAAGAAVLPAPTAPPSF